MKGLLLILVYGMLLSWSLSNTKPEQDQNNKNITAIPDSVQFGTHVMPLLQKKCSPCHFEGGKMHIKMPFDKASTIISHENGILKRFSNQEKMLLQKFIREYASGK